MREAVKRDTKTAIMQAAQSMMAEHGISGVSLRAILAEAGANTSALHYHFGSRDGLVDAILGRYGHHSSELRLEMMRKTLREVDEPSAHDIAALIVDPMIEMLRDERDDGRRFLRFLARLQSDRAGIHQNKEREHFPEIWEGMRTLVQHVCPNVPTDEMELRITMTIDTMLQSLANADFMRRAWDGESFETELDRFATVLKDYIAGGIGAPSTTS